MALNNILEQIKQETDAKLASLQHNYDQEIKKIDHEFEALTLTAKNDMDEQVKTNSKKIMDKMATAAKMEAKNKLLKAKRAVMDKVFEQALDRIISSSDYTKLITGLLKRSDIHGDDVTVLPAKGRENETKDAIHACGRKFKLADKSADIKGGFILSSEKIEIDNSFESILNKQLRDELELETAKLIFPA
ncbi:V-type ATP synthase subunit E [Candidatus Peregrinibacteria bacterium]|nr:V-type ATP synthase subunit E [Candidatus Peregrinibacteria bacterium]